MAEEHIDRRLTVPADRSRAWSVLTDVSLLASWIGIVHDVQEVEELKKYKAVLEDKVGPFKLRADLDMDVEVVAEGETVTVTASGRDRSVDSKITIRGTLDLAEATEGTTVRLTGKYQVTGKVASMGGAIIRKKADRVVDDFFKNAAAELDA